MIVNNLQDSDASISFTPRSDQRPDQTSGENKFEFQNYDEVPENIMTWKFC